jgi:putative FmdB family regulatory protein
MPTYEYECRKCGHQFELFQSIKDDPITKCPKPKCRGKVKRLVGTGAGIIFKGSGYYQTDYRSDAYKKQAKADATASTASTTSSSDTKNDSTAKTEPSKAKKTEK